MSSTSRYPAVILDMDGSAVDVRSVLHYLVCPDDLRDPDAYHAATRFCPPNESVLEVVRDAHEHGYRVLVVTARSEKYRHATVDWLRKHDVVFDRIYMRGWADVRPDDDVKRDVHAAISEMYDVAWAIDDNPHVIALWRSLGIPVVVVPGWPHADLEAGPVAVRNPFRAASIPARRDATVVRRRRRG